MAGAFLNQYFQSLVKIVSPLMPPIVVGTVAVLCGYAIAQSSSAILMMLGLDVVSSRILSIEVGMQVDRYFSWTILKKSILEGEWASFQLR
ncbi:unnamed protein product [Dovyalis caffra]|uniref:Uncharacterized protein n=1 Tax=Dovyalis caffra TaxID=77055 RepID=A0AAV1SGL8_9ROSI|nr:unnamed protein product [Dovyalis caffra]